VSDENKAVMHRFYDEWVHSGDEDALEEIIAPDCPGEVSEPRPVNGEVGTQCGKARPVTGRHSYTPQTFGAERRLYVQGGSWQKRMFRISRVVVTGTLIALNAGRAPLQ
jgi:hypothetical protein